MKINKTLTALIAGASLGLSGQAMAAGTTSGTTISNTVSLGYSVSGISQNDVESPSTFKVDKKVDMTLISNTGAADTIPGATVTLAYTIKNTGNSSQDYKLAVTNNGNAAHDPISVAFYSDAGLTSLLTDSKLSTVVDIDLTFYASVEVSKHASVVNGSTVEMVLTATALDPSDTDGTNLLEQDVAAIDDKNANLSTEYVIFAEAASIAAGVANGNAAQNGEISVQTDRNIVTADLTNPGNTDVPTLTIEIINDIICDTSLSNISTADYSTAGTCPNAIATNYAPKAIPNSMAKFTYEARNSGPVTAEDVIFTETLPSEYTASSLSNVTLTNDSSVQTLTDVGGIPAAANQMWVNGNTITIYVDDIETTKEFTITFTALVD